MEAKINLLPKQADAFDAYQSDSITELGYGGAAGGGKSRLGCYLAIYIAEVFPRSRGAIGRKELKTLRQTTLATLFEVFNELGYKAEHDFKYNAQDSKITFIPSDSEILLLDTAYSPQDPEYTRFGSLELTWAWIDESNETPLKAKSILKTRVGRKNVFKGATIKNFWLETFNPDKGHVYSDYYKPWKEGKLPYYRAFIRATAGDNPHLPQAYIENLRRADKMTRERLLEGNFEYDNDPSILIATDALEDLWTNTVEKFDKKFIVVDVARYGGDKTIITTWDSFEVVDIEIYQKLGVDEVADKVKATAAKYFVPFSKIIVDEDGVGGGVVDVLRGVKGFMANRTPFLNRFTGLPDNFKNLKTQCAYLLADYVNNHKIAIKNVGDDIKQMIREDLAWIKRKNADKDGKLEIMSKDEIKESLGRSPDIGDTLMMRMYFELEQPTQTTKNLDPLSLLLARRKAGTQEKVNNSYL